MVDTGFTARLFDELQPLFPDTNPRDGVRNYTISGVANQTYAGVQIFLADLEVGQFITVEVEGPHQKYKWFELLPLPVEVNTGRYTRTEWNMNDINPYTIRRAPFTIYDVQKPFTNVITPHGTSAALVFRCKVEVDRYTCQQWKLRVKQRDQIQELIVLVECYPETIGEVTQDDHKYVNWFGGESIANAHNTSLFSDKWFSMLEDYHRVAKYGRQNMICLPAQWYFDVDGNTVTLQTERLDKLIAIADKLGYHWIEGGHMAGRKDNEWEATEGKCELTGRAFSNGGIEDVNNIAQQLNTYLVEHNLKSRWIQSVMDEPLDCLADSFRLGVDTIKKAMPGTKILEATIARESIVSTVDYWCPTIDKFENYRDFFEERASAGDEIFVYTCLNPAGNYCNRLLDMERLRCIWLGWAPAKYESISGFLHWGGMYIDRVDPYYLAMPTHHAVDYEPAIRPSVLPAGDNAILYPDQYQALPSLRLEAQRIGLEDQILLKRLKAKNPTLANEIIAQVFRTYSDYSKEISAYREAKKKLFLALMQ